MTFTHYIKLQPFSVDQSWTANTVHAVIASGLCAPLILGLPWLAKNHIVVDHHSRCAIDKRVDYNLLNPPKLKTPPPPSVGNDLVMTGDRVMVAVLTAA